ncbi:MAG: hypothetical protein LAO06_20955 [Acidobacteriia bacterium]|nr:hypothetical protein [Terriglobia bacterium]
MKRALWTLGPAAMLLLSVVASMVFGQEEGRPPSLSAYHTVIPLRGASLARVRSAIAAATVTSATIPMWNYSVTSPADGNSYSGSMAGSSPFYNGARTTNIPTMVIPLIVVFPDGTRFDPTVIDSCAPSGTPLAQVLGSPIFQPFAYSLNGINVGTGQYVDVFQRANFFNANVSITGDSYHTMLSPVTTLRAQTINIPANQGVAYSLSGGCGKLGVMDISAFDSIITGSVLPSLAAQGVGPGNFPLFVLHDVVMGNPGTSVNQNCCVIGYHSALGFPVQTFAVADYDTTFLFRTSPDIAPTSHEVAEWMDDPVVGNPAPGWGHVGQVSGCQGDLEVGDPLTGSPYSSFGITMPNGVTYKPQQLAFFSWFYRQAPSLAAAGVYSNSGSFNTGAGQVCQ